MIGIGLLNIWLWLDGAAPARPDVPTGPGGAPLRRHRIDPILAARPEAGGIRVLQRTRRALDKRLREA